MTAVSAHAVVHSRDVLAEEAMEAFKPRRYCKRKKHRATFQRVVYVKGRSWAGLATLSLVATLLLALVSGAAVMAGLGVGRTRVEVAVHAAGTGGLLTGATWQQGLLSAHHHRNLAALSGALGLRHQRSPALSLLPSMARQRLQHMSDIKRIRMAGG